MPVPHVMPQPPQFTASVSGLLHEPPQLLSPFGQHRPLSHELPVPQLSVQLEQCVFVPSVTHVPPQFSWFDAQQMPRSQWPAPQPLPHAPQLF